MKLRFPMYAALSLGLAGCGPGAALTSDGQEDETQEQLGTIARDISFHVVFVHGVYSDDGGRSRAERSLLGLETHLRPRIASQALAYEAAQPGSQLTFQTYRVNLYTDANGQLVSPRIDDVADGSGVPSADRWRSQLSSKLAQVLPADARNIILVGHSTGARVAMEVAANVGGAGVVGARDWGWQARIAGVVTINGMIDNLQKADYNFIGTLSYLTGCKLQQGDGWCEYAARVSGAPAATWVARNKRALMLISAGSCSPSLWTGESDQLLPLRAQGVPAAYGMVLTPTPDRWGPAHGLPYGSFCHSDITDEKSPRHAAAKQAIADRILEWLFVKAPRVVNPDVQRFNVAATSANTWSAAFSVGGTCAGGDKDYSWPHVIGSCGHPGLFDGDDHPFNRYNQLDIVDLNCAGTFRWRHSHSGKNPAKVWMKVYSQPPGNSLVSTLQ